MRKSADDVVLVMTTAGSDYEAGTIGAELVSRRIAACVNVLSGVRSIYRWEGTVHDEREALLIIKTRAAHYDEVAEAIGELNSYDCPEVLMIPVSGGDSRYLAWLIAETDPG